MRPHVPRLTHEDSVCFTLSANGVFTPYRTAAELPFLASRSGDCDDPAMFVADLRREKGYSTRLVAVFMPHDVHVVCYVAETNSYLD